MTPDAALRAMMDGNQRYLAGQLRSLREDLSILRAHDSRGQEPFAAVLSCADFGCRWNSSSTREYGHLCVVRVAGNITTPEITASLEYGAAVLGTKVPMVLGHRNYSAVKANGTTP